MEDHAVLACLTLDERRASAVRAEAERLARELDAALSVAFHARPVVASRSIRGP